MILLPFKRKNIFSEQSDIFRNKMIYRINLISQQKRTTFVPKPRGKISFRMNLTLLKQRKIPTFRG